MSKRRVIRALSMTLLGALLVWVAVIRSGGRPLGSIPPAPAAPKAPAWNHQQADPIDNENSCKQPIDNENSSKQSQIWPPGPPPEQNDNAKYGWPADFELPLDIVIKDIPEIPEEIRAPSLSPDATP